MSDSKFNVNSPGRLVHSIGGLVGISETCSVYSQKFTEKQLETLKQIFEIGLVVPSQLPAEIVGSKERSFHGKDHTSFSMVARTDTPDNCEAFSWTAGAKYGAITLFLDENYVAKNSKQFKAIGNNFLIYPTSYSDDPKTGAFDFERFDAEANALAEEKSKQFKDRIIISPYDIQMAMEKAKDDLESLFNQMSADEIKSELKGLRLYELKKRVWSEELDKFDLRYFNGIKYSPEDTIVNLNSEADEVICIENVPAAAISAIVARGDEAFEKTRQFLADENLFNGGFELIKID